MDRLDCDAGADSVVEAIMTFVCLFIVVSEERLVGWFCSTTVLYFLALVFVVRPSPCHLEPLVTGTSCHLSLDTWSFDALDLACLLGCSKVQSNGNSTL